MDLNSHQNNSPLMDIEWNQFFSVATTNSSPTPTLQCSFAQYPLESSTMPAEDQAPDLSMSLDGMDLCLSDLITKSSDATAVSPLLNVSSNSSEASEDFDERTRFPTLCTLSFADFETNEGPPVHDTEAANPHWSNT